MARHSLEVLILDFRSYFDEYDYGLFGPLTCFETLKLLHINAYNLVDFDPSFGPEPKLHCKRTATIAEILPRSLESLHIGALEHQQMCQCFSQLISLGGLANEEFPLLRNILITAKAYVEDETRSIVKLTLANAGIAWRFTVYCGCFKKGWGGPKFSYRDLRHDEYIARFSWHPNESRFLGASEAGVT
jgi:hypothetical protein